MLHPVIYSIISLSSWQDSFFVWHIYFCSHIFFLLSIFFFFFCLLYPFFPFSYPFFTPISYLTNSFSIPQIDKWKKTYKRAHYPKKEYATHQPNTLCFAPALLLIPDNQDRRWAKVQVRKRMGLFISKYRLGYRHTGYGCRKKWNKIYHMDRTETDQQTGKPALNDKCCLFCGFISPYSHNPEENPTVRFFVLPITQLFSTFSFQVSPKYFLDGIFGNCLDFPFRLKLLSGWNKSWNAQSRFGTALQKMLAKSCTLWTSTWFKFLSNRFQGEYFDCQFLFVWKIPDTIL